MRPSAILSFDIIMHVLSISVTLIYLEMLMHTHGISGLDWTKLFLYGKEPELIKIQT